MRSPKYIKSLRALAATSVGLSFPIVSTLSAADIFKADNTTALNDVASWVSVLPSAADRVIWDARVNQGGQLIELGGSATWGSLKVENNVNELAVYDGTGTLSLTLGGVDLSAATPGNTFVLFGPVINNVAGKQTWSVADGAKFFASAASVLPAGATIDYNLGATGTGKFIWATGSTSTIHHYRTVNGGRDFVGYAAEAGLTVLGTPQDNAVRIVPAATAGRATASPSDGGNAATAAVLTTFPNDGYVDVTSSNGLATATAFNITNANLFPTNSGIRFNQPHTTAATDWIVSFGPASGTNNSRIQPGSPFAILVTPDVGARNVIFSNSGSGHEFRFNGTGTRLLFQQHNTAGDLIWRGDVTKASNGTVNASTSNATSIVKAGAGRLIFANASYVNGSGNAPVYVNEGTFQLGEGTTAGTLDNAPIVNNGAFIFNKSNDLIHNGVISGSGSLTFNTVGVASVTLGGANTYSGPTTINGGIVILNNATALGASPTISIAGGSGLRFGTGVSTDLSSQAALAFTGTGIVSLDTNGNNVTFANSFGAGTATSLTKLGAGVLSLGSANSYTGGTTVSAGGLKVINSTGSATGSGNVAMASGTTLSGNGRIAGGVTTATGTTVAPGNSGVGALTVGSLSLAASSIVDLEFSSPSSYDQIITTASNGLTVNGGGVHLYNTGGTSPWLTAGDYNIIQYSGTVQGTGPSALSVLNPQAGYAYTFGTNSGFLTLKVEIDAILTTWSPTGAGSWASSANWTNGVPASGYSALFTTDLLAPATITLDGNRTINGAVFDSPFAYTIAQGTASSLTLDKGAKNVAINVTQGSHVISAPVVLNSNAAVSTDANTGLTLSGAISGAAGIVKSGPGSLDLTAANSFAGAVNVVGGTLGFSTATGLGTGALTLNGGTLRYNTGNTADISSKVITFGQDGATIDTNGNDVIWMNPVGNGGAGLLTKAGSGILALDGANTHTGGTTAQAGVLRIASDVSLGAAGSTLTLNGGTLSSGTMTLGTGATDRPLVIGASGGSIAVDSASTLTVAGPMTGAGTLTKTGAGTLLFTEAPVAVRSGAVVIGAGTVRLGLDVSFIGSQSLLGTGSVTLDGGTLTTGNIDDNTQVIDNALIVPAGKTGTLIASNRFAVSSAVSGSGTLDFLVRSIVSRSDLTGNFTGFTGTLNIVNNTPSGTAATIVRLPINNSPAFNGASLVGTRVVLDDAVGITVRTNSGGNTIQIGELSGGAGGALNNEAGGAATFQIGALNTSSVYAGNIAPGNNTANHIIKVGTGTLTLSGNNTSTGNYTVNAGSLVLAGASDTVTTVTVAEGATLGGTGSLGGAVTVNGNLQTDSTGSRGGQLTLVGAGSLTLGATATTIFDFGGTVFTKVKSTASGAVTYGGALKINIPGTVYNGSYTLFELTGAPLGAFTGVSVSTANNSNAVLADTSGTWAGTDGVASFSFNSATGVLTVTGGATAVLPAVPAGVAATAGNAQVSLTWNAAANATSYIVKRSTVSGSGYQTVQSDVATTSFTNTGLTNGTTYYYVVQAKNAAGLSANSTEVSATPAAVQSHTALETWRFDQFGVYTDTGSVLAGDLEDYDGDGLVNLQEYAFGTNPKVANASPVAVGRNGDKLTLTYPRIVDAKLTYTVQGINDLTGTTWATVDTKTGNAAGSTVVEDTALLSANARRFLRLSVTYTP